uniref:Uncharacterized protein n=1 Tax=Megaselia scalaris TaxID=36166 RepID=T1GRA0_MEGSC
MIFIEVGNCLDVSKGGIITKFGLPPDFCLLFCLRFWRFLLPAGFLSLSIIPLKKDQETQITALESFIIEFFSIVKYSANIIYRTTYKRGKCEVTTLISLCTSNEN